ncbi:oligoendopeptidase F [Anaeromyxobacter oryzae]|uniref:Oligopeptidase F n=1 Tax=Anaeromyxobacter oryzae TaxID=2918170 RepID=A0ABM7WNJ2_9BACT|nr:oligoendopeptidase F [Anaeromyxobacter oryzae]BDG01039.1 oligoendopeptidase F [Anaeromyxobacter oryzae]
MPILLAPLAALALAATPAAPGGASPAATDRSKIPDKYKWKLSDLFPSDAAWAEAKDALARDVPGFARHKGHLGESPKALADALSDMAALQLRLERVYVYASSRSDEDTRDPKPRAMRAEAERLAVQLDAATSWVRPGILTLPAEWIRRAIPEDPRLKDWTFYLEDAIRWKPHTLTADEERIVAMTGDLSGAGRSVDTVLMNADLPYPTVTLASGEKVRLDQAGYQRARTSPNRADREKVFHAFFGALKGYERTIGAALYAQVKAHLFEKDVHKFQSSLESALFGDNIPVAVYTQLITDVNRNLPTLHRYLALRKRMMGLSQLEYEDLYAPLVKDVDRRYSIDQAIAMTLSAVAPLGKPYQAQLTKGFETGWTDFLPAQGKQAGAYSTGVYGVHPYQLLNFNGQWEDVSTLAHEAGHSMHTVLSYEHQPYPTSAYATFVAEVASTLNENLLFRKALADARTDPERLSLLGQHLETLRTTLFRQTMFAEFELAYHEAAEKGAALTGEKLSEIYLGLVRKYYGHDQGICRVAELYGDEWSFILHFFNYRFYVFQYATSLVASTSLAKAIREDEAHGISGARDRYLALLESGGSAYPVDLLKKAGVDMTTSAPFEAAMEEMNGTMDEIEAILARQKGGKPVAPAPKR